MLLNIRKWILLFLLILAIIFISISLCSFNPEDLSFVYDSSSEAYKITNILSKPGAYISSLFLYFLGFASVFILPILVLFIFIILNKINTKEQLNRIIAAILLIPVSAALFNTYSFEIFSGIYPGGIVGLQINKLLSYFLESQIIGIFLLVLTWSLLILIDRFASIKLISPIVTLFRAMPFRIIILCLFKLLNLIFKFIIILLKNLVDYFLSNSDNNSDNNSENNEKIYQDPFWSLYEQEESAETIKNINFSILSDIEDKNI